MIPTDDISNYKWGIFYYNPSDPRTLVPKRIAMWGWQLNYARPLSCLLILLLSVMIAFAVVMLRRLLSGQYS
jgi:uncharacterized membrane protein